MDYSYRWFLACINIIYNYNKYILTYKEGEMNCIIPTVTIPLSEYESLRLKSEAMGENRLIISIYQYEGLVTYYIPKDSDVAIKEISEKNISLSLDIKRLKAEKENIIKQLDAIRPVKKKWWKI